MVMDGNLWVWRSWMVKHDMEGNGGQWMDMGG